MTQGLPARDGMEDREHAAGTLRVARRLLQELSQHGDPRLLLRLADRIVTMLEEALQRTIDADETIAGVMVDLRTRPSAEERRRRITARDTEQRRARRQSVAVAR